MDVRGAVKSRGEDLQELGEWRGVEQNGVEGAECCMFQTNSCMDVNDTDMY